MSRVQKIIFQAVAIVLVTAAAFYIAHTARESEAVQALVADYGYAGIFAVAVLSGFNLVVPVPAVAFLPLFLESGLSFGLTVAVIALGVTVADLMAFTIGRVGRHLVPGSRDWKIVSKLERFSHTYHWVPLLFLFLFASFVPLPNEVLLIPLGFLGYGLRRVFPVIFLGNAVFNTLYAAGVINLFKIL